MGDNYDINYEDERFKDVDAEKDAALAEVENTYDDMIEESDGYYDSQIEQSKNFAEEQARIQQEQTDFAIEQIEQQKEQEEKDYKKEQSGAYADWQKQSNAYGTNAEQMAAGGMSNTGYSESSQVAMYTSYQNRVATARESFRNVLQNLNNGIAEAKLQNNAALAEIRYNAFLQESELILQKLTNRNNLLLTQMQHKQQVEDTYYARYQDVLDQINYENSFNEQVRQYEEEMARIRENDAKAYELELAVIEQEKAAAQAEQEAMLAQLEALMGGNNSGGNVSVEEPPENTMYNEPTTTYEYSNAFYQGKKNPDVEAYGTFEDGGSKKITVNGETLKLSNTGVLMAIEVTYIDTGEKEIRDVELRETPDSRLWIWSPNKNEYICVFNPDMPYKHKNGGDLVLPTPVNPEKVSISMR